MSNNNSDWSEIDARINALLASMRVGMQKAIVASAHGGPSALITDATEGAEAVGGFIDKLSIGILLPVETYKSIEDKGVAVGIANSMVATPAVFFATEAGGFLGGGGVITASYLSARYIDIVTNYLNNSGTKLGGYLYDYLNVAASKHLNYGNLVSGQNNLTAN